MEQQGIVLEDVKMKLFMYSLDEDARVWYKIIPHGKISSLKRFHIEFNHLYKILYPSGCMFEDFYDHFNVENIYEINDVAKDICGAQLRKRYTCINKN